MLAIYDDLIWQATREEGPAAVYRRLLAENDALIRSPQLDHGRAITTQRTAIHTVIAAEWVKEQVERHGYDKPFALAAVGGTGRGEVTPCSDLDFALLFDDEIEGNSFLLELQRQLLHENDFERQNGFACTPLPFSLDDVPLLAGKQLVAFVDLRALYDPTGLVERFRDRIRATFDPFEYFLYVRGFWKTQWEVSGAATERLDKFDIKNDGLRVFLAGIWTLASEQFRPSADIYAELEDPRDLHAYDFLLRIRSWLHLRRPPSKRTETLGNHAEDVMHFDDFNAFGEMLGPEAGDRERFDFANEVRARLLSARRRLLGFARGIIERELRYGRRIAPGHAVRLGAGGLYFAPALPPKTDREKSRAALGLLLSSQRYGLPIDSSELHATFRGAGDWLVRVPELSQLFHETRGSLAASFDFLTQVDGAVERLFPGYAQFEASLDSRVLSERSSLRGALERRKMRVLEEFLANAASEAALSVSSRKLLDTGQAASIRTAINLLDADHLVAVKVALKSKRLPLTPEDAALRWDTTRPRHERFASGFSGVPVEDYYRNLGAECEFSPECMQVAEFLVLNRRAFKKRSRAGINYQTDVEEFVRLCGNEQRLCALYVFTCADKAEWESAASDPARWFIIRELFYKALMSFRPGSRTEDTLAPLGYERRERAILEDFGLDFFNGSYRAHAARFGSYLVQLADPQNDSGPKAAVVHDGTSTMIGVAARDRRGLAAVICGALLAAQIELRTAHFFSATNQGLALDFVHVATNGKPVAREILRELENAIREQKYISEEDEAALPPLDGTLGLNESSPGRYRLHFETDRDARGLTYALTYRVYRYLGGSIHGLTAHASRGHAFISVYHTLPYELSLDRAREIVAERF